MKTEEQLRNEFSTNWPDGEIPPVIGQTGEKQSMMELLTSFIKLFEGSGTVWPDGDIPPEFGQMLTPEEIKQRRQSVKQALIQGWEIAHHLQESLLLAFLKDIYDGANNIVTLLNTTLVCYPDELPEGEDSTLFWQVNEDPDSIKFCRVGDSIDTPLNALIKNKSHKHYERLVEINGKFLADMIVFFNPASSVLSMGFDKIVKTFRLAKIFRKTDKAIELTSATDAAKLNQVERQSAISVKPNPPEPGFIDSSHMNTQFSPDDMKRPVLYDSLTAIYNQAERAGLIKELPIKLNNLKQTLKYYNRIYDYGGYISSILKFYKNKSKKGETTPEQDEFSENAYTPFSEWLPAMENTLKSPFMTSVLNEIQEISYEYGWAPGLHPEAPNLFSATHTRTQPVILHQHIHNAPQLQPEPLILSTTESDSWSSKPYNFTARYIQTPVG